MDIGGKKMKIDLGILQIQEQLDSSIQTRMLKNFAFMIVATVLFLEIVIISVINSYYYGGVEQILKDRVNLSAEFLNKTANYSSAEEKSNIMFSSSMTSYENKFLVQFISVDKNLIIDSNGFTDNMEINTPDVNAALENKILLYKGKSAFTGERILSASRPLIRYNKIDGVIRFVVSLEKIDVEIRNFVIGSLIIGILIIGFFIFTLSLISKSIIVPIQKLNKTAEEFAKGNFEALAEKRYNDEVGRLADTMNFMAKEIKNTEKLKIEFISSISHELRTPLTSIKGWSETLQMSEGYKKDSDVAIGLNIIYTEAERLSNMVEELLDFSRFQSNSMKIIKKPVNIKEIMYQVYRQFSNKRTPAQIKCDFSGKDTIVNADPNRLKQIYINLVTNAIKFTKEEGGLIQMIAIGYDDKIETIVKDNGIGIKEENLPHVIEKFYKGSSTMPGNGLGLSIVDELVRLQDGNMTLESEVNVGTTITIVFPAIIEETENEDVISEQEKELEENSQLIDMDMA